jgi:twitching motility protein PilT
VIDLNSLLTRAIRLGASDIHLKPLQKPFFRINRVLEEADEQVVTVEDVYHVLNELIPAHQVEHYKTDHEADFPYFIEGMGRFRVNAFQAQTVPVINFRYVKTRVPTFDELHLPPALRDICGLRHGIVFIAGTTGSGKSTTLAAMVEHINKTTCRRIMTVEDPVEYLFEDKKSVVTQQEIGLDTPSFDAALRHILRHDPDVICIGEMRDLNSIKTAISAAETGHLVISTVHSGTAPAVIHRVLEFFPSAEWDRIRKVFAVEIQAVLCQRLIPSVQHGVVPAVELMRQTPTTSRLIEKNELEKLADAVETGLDDGMMSFNQSIHQLIIQNLVSEEEGLRYSSNPAGLKMNLQGISLNTTRRILTR